MLVIILGERNPHSGVYKIADLYSHSENKFDYTQKGKKKFTIYPDV